MVRALSALANRSWMIAPCALLLSGVLWPQSAAAAPIITYRYDHHLLYLDPADYPDWRTEEPIWLFRGREIEPLPEWRVDGDTMPTLPTDVEQSTRTAWDLEAIASTIRVHISSQLNREEGAVTIRTGTGGGIAFDGVGMLGRRVDEQLAAELTVQAIENGIIDVWLPVAELQPTMTVEDPSLREKGITQVVTVGESDFAGSPLNRQHNISVGLSKFNGHLIEQGETFSFNRVLGPVNASTGYKPELVILGDRTLPEYGGGLCQISTTAYRGIWEHGFPIAQRKNHSYSVSYYSPQGTDATIYPPAVDMKFTNDGPSALLIQTHVDWEQQKAYFIYYGTRDRRQTRVIGPFTWGHVAAPPQRTEYTSDLAPGERKKLGSAVPGLRVAWYRIVSTPEARGEIEAFTSIYQARPLFYQVGVGAEVEPDASTGGATEPSWIDAP